MPLMYAPGRIAVCAVVLFATAMPLAQQTGTMRGTVTDTTGAVMPGVIITVTSSRGARTVVSDAAGRYAVPFLPSGSYTASADLAGFERAAYSVVVDPGATVDVPFVLRVGRCLARPIEVINDFRDALREATTIAHVTIAATSTEPECRYAAWCVCTEHLATVRRVMKTDRSAAPGTIRFLQTQSHRAEINEDGAVFQPGQEFVAFLQWDEGLQALRTYYSPSLYVLPVRDGRVAFTRTDVPGLRDGMPVDRFIDVVDGMLRTR